MVKPLSDPWGGTELLNGRHPIQMSQPKPKEGLPEKVVFIMSGMCQTMESGLRLYGHPDLLTIAASINGDDFVPYVSSNSAIKKRSVPEGLDVKDYLGLLGISSQCGYFAVNNATEVLKRGDEVITSGGIIGVVDKVMEDDRIEVTIGENTKVQIIRSTITSLLKKEEVKK